MTYRSGNKSRWRSYVETTVSARLLAPSVLALALALVTGCGSQTDDGAEVADAGGSAQADSSVHADNTQDATTSTEGVNDGATVHEAGGNDAGDAGKVIKPGAPGDVLDITSCVIAPDSGAAGSSYCGPVPTTSGAVLLCGGCTDPLTPFCDLFSHTCKKPASTCADLKATCGTYRTECNTTINCDLPPLGCLGDQRCDGATRSCVACTVLSCADFGYECGNKPYYCQSELALSGGNLVSCGNCEAFQGTHACDQVSHTCKPKASYCDADAGVPGGVAQFCADSGYDCGVVFDGCGGVVSCGACQAGYECGGGGGVPNKCAKNAVSTECIAKNLTCTPPGAPVGTLSACTNLPLDCGTCGPTEICVYSGTESHCTGCASESDAQFCARMVTSADGGSPGTLCGPLSGTDNCARPRNTNCGTCVGTGQTCGEGVPGAANVCGCTPETDAAYCARNGKDCGSFAGTDNCGVPRTANCGSACSGPGGASCGGGGTPNVCGCLDAAACAGKDCGTVVNACGATVSCGAACAMPSTCGGGSPGAANVCGCTPETNAAFCARNNKNCGSFTGLDNCGATRTANCGASCPGTGASCGGGGTPNVCGCTADNTAACSGKNCGNVTNNCGANANCGSCTNPNTCGGGNPGTPNVCGCTPETNAAFCARNNKNCGSFTGLDNCGATRTVNCGASCPRTGASCGGGGTPNVCGCTPDNAAACSGKNCGNVTNNCGANANCGSCTNPNTCGGGNPGTPNICGCTPQSDAAFCAANKKNCGTFSGVDNCGAPRTANCGASCAGTGASCGGGGTSNVCGCTPDNTAACSGKNCGTVTNNCGRNANCGSCTTPNTCGGGNPGTANICGCTPETDAAFCARQGKNCGTVSGVDNCGAPRTANCGSSCPGTGQTCGGGGAPNVCGCTADNVTACAGFNCGTVTNNCGKNVSCGSCSGPDTCGGGNPGTPKVCGCTPESDAAFCSRNFKNCGSYTGVDNCGVTRTTNCGASCPGAGQSCGGGGTPNVCGCTPNNVAACNGLNCGNVTNNCGATVSCGSCSGPNTCGGGSPGTPNVCGCTPTNAACSGKNCGNVTNNCGATVSCGSCAGPNTCGGGSPGTSNVCGCTPDNVAACSGKNCGNVTNNCGATVSCGSCSSPNTCGGGNPGSANVCGCTPESDAAYCIRLAKNCGVVPGIDNCGSARSVDCGTCPVNPQPGQVCGAPPLAGTIPNVCCQKRSCTVPVVLPAGAYSDNCGSTITCTG